MRTNRALLVGTLSCLSFIAAGCGGDDSKAGAPTADAGPNDGTLPTPDGGVTLESGAHDTASPKDGTPPPPQGITMSQYFGVNAFIDDPTDKLAPVGVAREYHNWGWLADNFAAGPAYPSMLYTFMNFNGWDWDKFFGDLKAKGSAGWPAVQGSVPWMNSSAVPPVMSGADKTDPKSYVAHGDVMFQIAARYGGVQVPDAKLKLKAGQTRVSGLGTVSYFEDFNEPDLVPAFTPDALAAMASADYDGDQGRLGDTFGVKNADPNAKLVLAGLSGSYNPWVGSVTAILDGVRAWAQTHRAGSFPADVINVHYYSFGPSGFGTPNPKPALSPEDDKVREKLGAIVAYRNQNLPGKPVWWTEFGYDTYVQSNLHAPALGGNSEFIVQGQWLVRDILAALSSGIDRATLFVLRDSCKTTDTACQPQIQFNTCGLTSIKGEWTPKASWYFLATFRSRLSSMVFAGEQTSGGVMISKFRDTLSSGGAFVLWSPTSAATVVPGFSLPLPAGATKASSVTLADQQANGVEAPVTVTGGNVTLDVSETPVIVLVDRMP